MARRRYPRSRRNRRRPGRHPRTWIGIAVLGLLAWWLWPRGSAETDAAAPPEAEHAVTPGDGGVIQAGEFGADGTPRPTATLVHVQGESVVDVNALPVRSDAPAAHVEQTVREAMALFHAGPGHLIEARSRLNALMLQGMAESQRELVRQAMTRLSKDWLFSRTVYPDDPLCSYYHVQSGDRLQRIGEKYKVPYEILMQINGIQRASDLRADSKIKVLHGPFNAKIYRTTYTMDVYLQKTLVKSYRVGLGQAGSETPTGEWLVKPGDKMVRPQWTDKLTGRVYRGDDPDYPLGSRWIGLQGISGEALGRTGFAIHGTNDPQSIGTRSSQGCVRLYNGDVVEVYGLLLDGVSRVLIADR